MLWVNFKIFEWCWYQNICTKVPRYAVAKTLMTPRNNITWTRQPEVRDKFFNLIQTNTHIPSVELKREDNEKDVEVHTMVLRIGYPNKFNVLPIHLDIGRHYYDSLCYKSTSSWYSSMRHQYSCALLEKVSKRTDPTKNIVWQRTNYIDVDLLSECKEVNIFWNFQLNYWRKRLWQSKKFRTGITVTIMHYANRFFKNALTVT